MKKLVPKLVPIVILPMTAVALGTSVRLANLVELVGLAGLVFHGRCTRVEKTEVAGFPAIHATFEVLDAVKGVDPGGTVTFQQVAASRDGVAGIPGLPSYRKGEEVVLFLARDGGMGLTSPIGLGQGVFRVRRDAGGRRMVANILNNRNLSLGIDQSGSALMGLSARDWESLAKGPARLESLISAARKIHDFQSAKIRRR